MDNPPGSAAGLPRPSRAARPGAEDGGSPADRRLVQSMLAVGLSMLCFVLAASGQPDGPGAIRLTAGFAVATCAVWLMLGIERQLRCAIDATQFRQGASQPWATELEALVGSVGSAVFAVAPDGAEILFVSRQVHEIYGVAPETFYQSPALWHELIHPADQVAVARLTRQLRRSGRFEVEYRVLAVGGSVRWVRHRGRLQVDAGGQAQRITGVITDISRRKERSLRLQASEMRLAGLIRASMDGIVTVDEARCVVLYNPAAEKMFGRPANDVIGRPVDQLLAGSCRGRFLVLDKADGASEDRLPQTVNGVRGDGSEFTMEATLAHHAVGGQHFATAMLRDITERLATETRLQQLSSALEQSPVSIQITDTDFRICYVNQHFCTVTGYAPREVLGQRTNILKSGETPESDYRRLRTAVASGEEWCGEFRNRRKDGSLYWEFARIMPITGNDGRVTHFLALKEDVSEKKAMEERERERQEELAHSARLILLGEMSSSLAHEINQPLMAIAGYSAACSRAVGDSPHALALLGKIDAQVARAGEIVWRTRNFARRHSSREAFNLATLVFSVIDWMSAEAHRYGITLDTDGVQRTLPSVRADRLQIEQVLLNLAKNAFDALRDAPGERRVVFMTRYASDSGELVLSVQDTGCGVPPQVAMDVFQPFFTTKPTGLGLGLSISRSIIEDHGGSLWYTASTGGTTFHFSLPIAPLPPSFGY